MQNRLTKTNAGFVIIQFIIDNNKKLHTANNKYTLDLFIIKAFIPLYTKPIKNSTYRSNATTP